MIGNFIKVNSEKLYGERLEIRDIITIMDVRRDFTQAVACPVTASCVPSHLYKTPFHLSI